MEKMDPTISGSDNREDVVDTPASTTPPPPSESVASIPSSSSDVSMTIEQPPPSEPDDAISSTTADRGAELKEESIPVTDADADLFSGEFEISDVRNEKVVEDVEDIVQDLENLLGGGDDSYTFTKKPLHVNTNKDNINVDNVLVSDNVKPELISSADTEPTTNQETIDELLPSPSSPEVPPIPVQVEENKEVTESVTVTEEATSVSKEDEEVESCVVGDVTEPQDSQIDEISESLESEQVTDQTEKDQCLVDDQIAQTPEAVTSDQVDEFEPEQVTQESESVQLEEIESEQIEATAEESSRPSEPEESVIQEDSTVTEPETSELEPQTQLDESIPFIEEEEEEEEREETCSTLPVEVEEESPAEESQTFQDYQEATNEFSQSPSLDEAEQALEEIARSEGSSLIGQTVEYHQEGNAQVDDVVSSEVLEADENQALKVTPPSVESTNDLETFPDTLSEELTQSPLTCNQTDSINDEVAKQIREAVESIEGTEEPEPIASPEHVEDVQVEPTDEEKSVETTSDSPRDSLETNEKSPTQPHSTTEVDSIFVEGSSEDDSEQTMPSTLDISKAVKPLTVDVDSDGYLDDVSKSVASVSTPEREPLRITITKNKTDNEHSILKIYDPKEEEYTIPKLKIRSVAQSADVECITVTESVSKDGAIPKLTIKTVTTSPDTHSPRTHSKNISSTLKSSPIKLTIKPVKADVDVISKEDHPSPKITIKPVVKPEETAPYSPRITIKPVVRPDGEDEPKPRIIIKQMQEAMMHSPKITIKPVVRPPSDDDDSIPEPTIHSPKITIKPVVKPVDDVTVIESIDYDEQIQQERIVLKIQKTRKDKDEEKLDKIKVKLSKQRGVARIVSTRSTAMKRAREEEVEREQKLSKIDSASDISNASVSYKEESLSSDDVEIVGVIPSTPETDPLADIPVFEISTESIMEMATPPPPVVTPMPRKRGRPRKVPLEVREDFKDPKEAPPPPERPKRSCRGASVTVALGIKPRKPRGPGRGRGRGGKRDCLTRAEEAQRKEPKLSATKVRLLRQSLLKKRDYRRESDLQETRAADPKYHIVHSADSDVVMIEEETRMSADNSSRAHTPAKQVLSNCEVVEESQSSVQSSATESSEKAQKLKKGPRLEVHQEPEGEVISAEQLAEYCWGGGGPYMLQEQVAQFLGIKSFKRKYPGMQRRPVDMQERDFIRESGLASEGMCDMGLTAVKSEDILDIMYTDFQHKYEEYCKHQRDRQAKEVCNKQKALSLAASQEKNKLDMVEQAVQSCLSWNNQFNKSRRENRKASMDLQTFTVHYPKGKIKQVNRPPVGNYPVAVVPGQFTDYYKTYTPEELGAMPLHTIGFKGITLPADPEDSQSDGSGSESESSSSDSDSSSSDSSGVEGCKMCSNSRTGMPTTKKVAVH